MLKKIFFDIQDILEGVMTEMTVKECYEQINGDYEGVFGRFRGDERIKKFAVKF